MAKEGSKRVEIAGIGDKRQLAAVFASTMNGDFLPPQIMYTGKTSRCLPSITFPSNWDVTFTQNHWANENTTERYIKKILVPYIEQKRHELALGPQYPDRFNCQCTENIFSQLEVNNICLVVVPANCTDRLQPLDVSVNKSAKEYLRRRFQHWYSDKVCKQMAEGEEVTSIDLCMSTVKPLGAEWLIGLYDFMKSRPDTITNGFKEAGIIF